MMLLDLSSEGDSFIRAFQIEKSLGVLVLYSPPLPTEGLLNIPCCRGLKGTVSDLHFAKNKC